jgi:putative DNA primase/helicase
MTRIAARLVDLECQSVKVIDWPDAPDKGDAANAVAQGVDVRALIAAARPWTPDKTEILEEARLGITALEDVVSEQVEPLWPKRIFRRKLAVMAGDPGLGKSYASLDIAARVSLGGPWPDGSGCAPRGNVLLLSAEDGVADTIKPRLELVGADMSRIFNLGLTVHKGEAEVGLSLQEHLPQIEQKILEKKIILLVVDPLLAFTGKVDTHKTAEVRAVLSPMSAMAERTGCVILAVMHPNKNSKEGNLLYRISASLDFAAAARSVMVVAKHPDNPDQRVMATVKCNLSAHPQPIAFGFTHDGCFAWQGVTEVDVAQLMASPIREEDRNERAEAKDFLKTLLADGPVPANQVEEKRKELGIASRTLSRAKDALGIVSLRSGTGGQGQGKGRGKTASWYWYLPEHLPQIFKIATPPSSYQWQS